jgi:hypothetical protein
MIGVLVVTYRSILASRRNYPVPMEISATSPQKQELRKSVQMA